MMNYLGLVIIGFLTNGINKELLLQSLLYIFFFSRGRRVTRLKLQIFNKLRIKVQNQIQISFKNTIKETLKILRRRRRN